MGKTKPRQPTTKGYAYSTRKIIPQLGTVYDLAPTILNLAGTQAPKGHRIDGIDIAPFLKGDKTQTEREFLMHFPHQHRSSYFTSYRKGDWKLIYHYHHSSKTLLIRLNFMTFQMIETSSKNLASSHPEKLKSMMKDMVKSLKNSGAQMPLSKDKKATLMPKI